MRQHGISFEIGQELAIRKFEANFVKLNPGDQHRVLMGPVESNK